MNGAAASKSFEAERDAGFEAVLAAQKLRGHSLARGKLWPPIIWLNLLCLDAPLVAVSWQAFFARSLHLPISFGAQAALFVAAWLIYLSDRFADAQSIRQDAITTVRQKFCRQHSAKYVALIAAVTLAEMWIILRQLQPRIILAGVVVGGLSAIYLIVNYSLGRIWRRVPAKEISIGILFACGTSTAFFAEAGAKLGALILMTLCFAALCTLNCISIAVWERALDLAQGKDSLATRCDNFSRELATIGAALAFAFAVVAAVWPQHRAVFVCMAASGGALVILHAKRNAVPLPQRTALADLVLLTPLLARLLVG